MHPITRADIVDIAQYELERQDSRAMVIELKRSRRVQVGDLVTLVFENRDTVRFQIQEMMRAERIVTDDRIQQEIDTYNELIPPQNSLSATLLIEITDQEHLREILDRFIGLDHGGTTFLLLGSDRVEADYEGGRSKEDRVSAVHYVTFTLTDTQISRITSTDTPLSFEVRHGDYAATVTVPAGVRYSLASDLASP